MQAYPNPNSTPVRLIEAFYTGTNLSSLNVVASNVLHDVIFKMEAGKRYSLALDLQDPRVSVRSAATIPGPNSAATTQLLLSLFHASELLSPNLRPTGRLSSSSSAALANGLTWKHRPPRPRLDRSERCRDQGAGATLGSGGCLGSPSQKGVDHVLGRVYDARSALTITAQGVKDFATVNIKDYEGFGFRRVWNPLAIQP